MRNLDGLITGLPANGPLTLLNEHGLPIRRRETTRNGDATPAELALAELASRELSRRRFLPYLERNMPTFELRWYHYLIGDALERFSAAVGRGESPRLIIEMPPRHGKSEMVSRTLPAWHLGRFPDHEVMACSYGADLARDFSRKVRSQLADEEYNFVFPDVELDPASRAADRWNIEGHAGGYVAAGVGGPITGRGMHVGIIDDYVKNWEEADSKDARDKLWAWYESTFRSRLAPGGGIIIMATRWNDDDLIGRVLRDEPDRWVRIRLPAEAVEDEYYQGRCVRKKGEALHPSRYDNEFFAQFKRNARIWNALYQQDPISEGGSMFPAKNFRTYRAVERPALEDLTIISAWDFAVGKNEDNDYTVGVVGGIDRDYRLWGLDQIRGQMDTAETVDAMISVYRMWRPFMWGFEHGQISLSIGPFLARRLVQEQIYDLDWEASAMRTGRRDKVARAKPLQGFVKLGMFLFPEETEWYEDMKQEFIMFPRGEHDDQVDAWAWLAQLGEQFISAGYVEPQKPAPTSYGPSSWRDRLKSLGKKGPTSSTAMAS